LPFLCLHGKFEDLDETKRKAIITVLSRYSAAGIITCSGLPTLADFCWYALRLFMYGSGEISEIPIEMSKTLKAYAISPVEAILRTIPGVGKKIASAFVGKTVYELCSLTIPGISLIISGLPPTDENIEKFKKKPYEIARTIYEFLRGKKSNYVADEWLPIPKDDESLIVEDDESG